MPVVEQDLLTLPEYLDSPPDVGSVRVLHFVQLYVFELFAPCCEVCYDLSLKQYSFRLYFYLIDKEFID